jgi:electron transport complex protein RnfB
LCLPVCPVDCIVMEPDPALPPAFVRAPQFRARFEARTRRLEGWAREDEARRRDRRTTPGELDPVAEALRRAQALPS